MSENLVKAVARDWNKASAIGSWVQAIGVIATLLILVWQVHIDHRQRRLQSTLSFVMDASREYRKIDAELCGRDENGNPKALTPERVAQILDNNELNLKAEHFLAEFEWMATGVNRGILDLDTVIAMRGSYIVNLYQRWHPYMQRRIQTAPAMRRQTLYDQFALLSKQIAEKRDLPDNLMPAVLIREFPDG